MSKRIAQVLDGTGEVLGERVLKLAEEKRVDLLVVIAKEVSQGVDYAAVIKRELALLSKGDAIGVMWAIDVSGLLVVTQGELAHGSDVTTVDVLKIGCEKRWHAMIEAAVDSVLARSNKRDVNGSLLCSRCGEPYPYAEATRCERFTCYSCRSGL